VLRNIDSIRFLLSEPGNLNTLIKISLIAAGWPDEVRRPRAKKLTGSEVQSSFQSKI
jgi:hypothetical protein